MHLSQTIRSAVEDGAIREGTATEAAPLICIYETLIGIGTVARTCEHLLHKQEPDIAELRMMVSSIIAASNGAIAIIRD